MIIRKRKIMWVGLGFLLALAIAWWLNDSGVYDRIQNNLLQLMWMHVAMQLFLSKFGY